MIVTGAFFAREARAEKGVGLYAKGAVWDRYMLNALSEFRMTLVVLMQAAEGEGLQQSVQVEIHDSEGGVVFSKSREITLTGQGDNHYRIFHLTGNATPGRTSVAISSGNGNTLTLPLTFRAFDPARTPATTPTPVEHPAVRRRRLVRRRNREATDKPVDYRLVDGEQRHAQNPRSFFIPDRDERESLQPGDIARLLFEIIDPGEKMPSGERMWVEITQRVDDGYLGYLTNMPTAITTVSVGDDIRFGPQHVISTAGNCPLLDKKKMFVSRRSQEQDVRPGYVYREDPDSEHDSGWRALVGDESDEEAENPDNILLQGVGFVLDRWPELRPVLATDPSNGTWAWHETEHRYALEPDDE